MELKEAIKKRRSVRKFKKLPLPVEWIVTAIELAQTGPSAGGIRGWEVFMTFEPISHYEAPCYIVICANQGKYIKRYGDRGYDLYSIQDAAIVAAYLQLLLVDIGLGSCWIGAFNEGRVKRAVGANYRPVAVLAVGYPEEGATDGLEHPDTGSE